MSSAHVGVVHVEDVTGFERVPAQCLGGELHADLEISQEDGQARRQAEDVGLVVEERSAVNRTVFIGANLVILN